ncbi:MAG: hypothetical protein LUE89_11260 [Clostridiales bacterium]|nr:hypothetical protein [Clostridiales bacterium]
MVTMTDKIFCKLFGEALADEDRDAFCSDWALSSIWGDPEELAEGDELTALAEACGKVWDLARMSVKDIRSATGLTQGEFAVRFCIPRRTVENWESRGGCPPYVRLMLARLCGLAEVG